MHGHSNHHRSVRCWAGLLNLLGCAHSQLSKTTEASRKFGATADQDKTWAQPAPPVILWRQWWQPHATHVSLVCTFGARSARSIICFFLKSLIVKIWRFPSDFPVFVWFLRSQERRFVLEPRGASPADLAAMAFDPKRRHKPIEEDAPLFSGFRGFLRTRLGHFSFSDSLQQTWQAVSNAGSAMGKYIDRKPAPIVFNPPPPPPPEHIRRNTRRFKAKKTQLNSIQDVIDSVRHDKGSVSDSGEPEGEEGLQAFQESFEALRPPSVIRNRNQFPWENLVFEGGGNKGMAYVGALRVSITCLRVSITCLRVSITCLGVAWA